MIISLPEFKMRHYVIEAFSVSLLVIRCYVLDTEWEWWVKTGGRVKGKV